MGSGGRGFRFEACGYAAFLQNAGLFWGRVPRVCTLGWYVMPLQGIRSETWLGYAMKNLFRV